MRGIVTGTVRAAPSWSLRSLGPVPRTGTTVYANALPRSSVAMAESHQRNFWMGATLLGIGWLSGPRGAKPILLKRYPCFSPLLKPGARRMAKPRKSGCDLPSGQSSASNTSVGERYARAFTWALAMTSLPSVSFEAPGSEAQDRSLLSVDRVSCALSSHLLGGYDRFAHVRCQREPSVTR